MLPAGPHMSHNPFTADAGLRDRYARRAAEIGLALSAEVAARAALGNAAAAANMGSILPAAYVDELVARFDLTGVDELMVLSLDAAKALARPPISGFYVGAIGLERETGNLILGGNVEFPGASLAYTLHGEGFVFARAFSRDTSIAAIAIGEAHPCAHCRQFISEFAAAHDLRLIDPLGHRLGMAELYPWPFDPDYLGEPGVVAGQIPFPDLRFSAAPPPEAIAASLLAPGRRAHAPYGKCPAAVVLELSDGTRFTGSAIESVSFNPGLVPLQTALVDLLAHGRRYGEIVRCWLGCVTGGRVGHERGTAELLSAIAPQAKLEVIGWQG